jgi:hypothetical protein
VTNDHDLLRFLYEAVEAENRGDLDTWSSYFAEDVQTTVNGTTISTNRSELVKAIAAGRARGWTAQRIISATAQARVLTYHYVNEYLDGHTTRGAGVALFDATGKVTTHHALTAGAAATLDPA